LVNEVHRRNKAPFLDHYVSLSIVTNDVIFIYNIYISYNHFPSEYSYQ